MSRHALGPVVASLVLVAAACGAEATPPSGRTTTTAPPATATAPQFPVAYRLSREDALRLADTDPVAHLEQRGEPVASSEWEGSYGVFLALELEREHRIDLMTVPRDLRRVVSDLADEHEVTTMVLTERHRQRFAERLRATRLARADLRRGYEDFYAKDAPEAAEATGAWLDVFRTALAQARGDDVVVVVLD